MNSLLVIAEGEVELLVKGQSGAEIIIGRVGPGAVLGGACALGLTTCQLFSARRVQSAQEGHAEDSMSLAFDDLHKVVPTKRQDEFEPVAAYVMTATDLESISR